MKRGSLDKVGQDTRSGPICCPLLGFGNRGNVTKGPLLMNTENPEHNFGPCNYCTGPVRAQSGPRCGACLSLIHRDCWSEFEGCPTYGCVNSPDMRQAASGQGGVPVA